MSQKTDSNLLKELKIYYLYLHADGELSPKEKEMLNNIIEYEGMSGERGREFRAFCGQMVLEPLAEKPETVISAIDLVLGGSEFAGDFDTDKSLQADVIWTLINLGYADKEYSAAEKKVVDHLIERWEMDPILVDELNDTAETMLALTRQKDWLQTTSKPYEQIKSAIEEIDQNMDDLFSNMAVTISEANIA